MFLLNFYGLEKAFDTVLNSILFYIYNAFFREEFKVMLDELEWMDEKTRVEAHKKVNVCFEMKLLYNSLCMSVRQSFRL